MAFARLRFEVTREVQGVKTVEHLRRAAKGETRGARKAQETLRALETECPPEWLAIYDVFLSLDKWRGAGGMGMAPLTLHDIEAWERRYGGILSADEVDVVKQLDIVRLNASAAKVEKP